MNFKNLLTFLICSSALFHFGCNKDNGSSTRLDDENEDEIVHGQPIKNQEEISKSIVALVFQKAVGQSLCTGTLIGKDLVLTAAHCVEGKPQQIVVVFAPKVKGVAPTLYRRGDVFTQNARWHNPTEQGRGDLALIHFAGDLPEGYRPTNLAARKLTLREGTDVLLAGYGVTDGDRETGSGTLRETHTTVIGKKSSTEIITDGHKSSVCFGDSGGPGFVKVNDEFVQWGVASSVSNHSCNESSIHTSVMPYRPWIQTTAKQLRNRSGEKQKRKTRKPKTPNGSAEYSDTSDSNEPLPLESSDSEFKDDNNSLENISSDTEYIEELN